MSQSLALHLGMAGPAVRSAARTHVGRVRSVNEDRLLDLPEAGLWAVADGMGGHVAGGAAATDAVRALCALAVCATPTPATIATALADAHAEIRAAGDGRGTTIAGLLIAHDRCTVFWIGDSRVYRLRDGRLDQLSRDHSVVQEMVDAGALTPEQAARHQNANVITRAIGIGDWAPPATAEHDARGGDRFLICSDGLSSLIDAATLANMLADEPAAATDRLIAAALEAGGTDNITAIVVALD